MLFPNCDGTLPGRVLDGEAGTTLETEVTPKSAWPCLVWYYRYSQTDSGKQKDRVLG